MSFLVDQILAADLADAENARLLKAQQEARCARILAGCTPKQRAFILDPSSYKSLRCPRRAGKSFAMSAAAVYTGESVPGSRILVISLTLKSTKENYWSGSPSGIFTMDRLFDLGLRYHHTDLVWYHQNGSRGRLAGAETRADIEYLRGAAAEADVVILDECKSFAPGLLEELIREVLEPGLMTRDGRIIMGGTPGVVPVGPFYEATCESHRVEIRNEANEVVDTIQTCVRYDPDAPMKAKTFINDAGEEEAADEPWSLHAWSVKDNTAAPKQWARALRIKRRAGWSDDHPTWRREYLGEWVQDGEGLVYTYAAVKAVRPEDVTWHPRPTPTNKTGLDPDEGPWHLIMGLDLGFEADTALIVAAYSERLTELRHVWDYKASHMYPPDVLELIHDTIARFGHPVAVVADAGGLGKMLVEWFNSVGIPLVKAEKTEKFDHIELLNGDFLAGRIKIVPGSDLDNELCGLQWDLSQGTKAELVRANRLREDKRLPNHLCDALLYLWRYSYHHFAQVTPRGPEKGTPEWYEYKEREAEMAQAKALAGEGDRRFTTDGHPSLGVRRVSLREELRWRSALSRLN